MTEQRLSEGLALVSCIDPDAYTASTVIGDEIDMQLYDRLICILMAGTLGSSATLDYKIRGTGTAGGVYVDLTGKAITQLTEAGTDSDKQAIIEVTAAEVKAQGYRYVKDSMTVGTATSDCGAIILGQLKRHVPASGSDLASVDEIVT